MCIERDIKNLIHRVAVQGQDFAKRALPLFTW